MLMHTFSDVCQSFEAMEPGDRSAILHSPGALKFLGRHISFYKCAKMLSVYFVYVHYGQYFLSSFKDSEWTWFIFFQKFVILRLLQQPRWTHLCPNVSIKRSVSRGDAVMVQNAPQPPHPLSVQWVRRAFQNLKRNRRSRHCRLLDRSLRSFPLVKVKTYLASFSFQWCPTRATTHVGPLGAAEHRKLLPERSFFRMPTDHR